MTTDDAPRGWVREKMLEVLAGLELGVLGGVLTLLWYVVIAPVLGQPWWTIPNLFASKHYPMQTAAAGFVTVYGSALQIALGGLVGLLTGLWNPRSRLAGLGTALGWYLLSHLWLWKRLAPGLLGYSPQAVLAIGFFVFGSVLGYYEKAVRGLRASS